MTEEIERLENAVLDARQTGDPAALGDALWTVGRAYFETGNTPKGLTQVEAALEIAVSTNHSSHKLEIQRRVALPQSRNDRTLLARNFANRGFEYGIGYLGAL